MVLMGVVNFAVEELQGDNGDAGGGEEQARLLEQASAGRVASTGPCSRRTTLVNKLSRHEHLHTKDSSIAILLFIFTQFSRHSEVIYPTFVKFHLPDQRTYTRTRTDRVNWSHS